MARHSSRFAGTAKWSPPYPLLPSTTRNCKVFTLLSFTARIAGVSTKADGQLTARCHDTGQAHHGLRTPRRRWPAAPPMRADAFPVHVAGRVGAPMAGEDVGAHRDRRRAPDARRAETNATSITWPAPAPAPRAPAVPRGVNDQTRWLRSSSLSVSLRHSAAARRCGDYLRHHRWAMLPFPRFSCPAPEGRNLASGRQHLVSLPDQVRRT